MRTRLKVCCISSREEAALAVRLGAHALGLVSRMPSGPGVIADDAIAEIARTVPPGVATFLLTSATDAGTIIAHVARAGVGVVQLVDEVEAGTYGAIRRELPNVRIVQVIHVVDDSSVVQAIDASAGVDAVLLDSGRPKPPPGGVKELGGTGRVHDWSLSNRIVEEMRSRGKPVWLAGGLHAENVLDAVERVRPFGVDVCSGVRRDGALSEERLAALVGMLGQVRD
ncbi:MAG: phosphoribosylanthranilate isomerase [Planctomycetes bacterium]|nr:phosphoribosylanthranilate isomerase [Planctomycetota bacterium]